MSKVLIIAEHLDGKLNASTSRCVTCAKDFKAESIDVLVLAADVAAIAADAAKIDGVAKVLTLARAENAHALAAVLAPQIAAVAKNGYTHVLAPSTTFGKDLLPRVA
ncbi:MAG TPA: electron transfer flavoprotein subunit alpha/FixB family protein, partial [Rhodanobacteraceae bacterium]